jgi:hypothetical protein
MGKQSRLRKLRKNFKEEAKSRSVDAGGLARAIIAREGRPKKGADFIAAKDNEGRREALQSMKFFTKSKG